MVARIDSHQHLWRVSERRYSWITPDYEILNRDFDQREILPDLDALGIEATVLVQAADTYEDTLFMVSQALDFPRIKGVVGWVPLDRTAEARVAIDAYSHLPIIKGIRNLTHDYRDPGWIRQPACLNSLDELARRDLSLDYVCTRLEHAEAIRAVATEMGHLRVVIDHMARPPFDSDEWGSWADSITALAQLPNVWCKVSGLSTVSATGWSAEQWEPAVDHCVTQFGSKRLMMGSDWPVVLLAGSVRDVWLAQEQTLGKLSQSEREDVLANTARAFYRLDA